MRGMSRSEGVDLFSGVGVHEALDGVDVVVDVVRSPSFDEAEATHFFRRTSVILGRAARRAGVERSVVLSVLGCDRVAASRDADFGLDGYYRAKFAHELATKEEAPNPHVLRSSQLFNFVGQEVARGRVRPNVTHIPDLTIQPIDANDTVRALLALATGEDDRPDVQVAGPRRESLVDLAQQFVGHHREQTAIVPLPLDRLIGDGLLLPGIGADLMGRCYDEWLSEQPINCVAEDVLES